MKKPIIVAEYDYYTLEQARRIIERENKEKRKENLKTYFSAILMLVIPMLYIVDWIICGY